MGIQVHLIRVQDLKVIEEPPPALLELLLFLKFFGFPNHRHKALHPLEVARWRYVEKQLYPVILRNSGVPNSSLFIVGKWTIIPGDPQSL